MEGMQGVGGGHWGVLGGSGGHGAEGMRGSGHQRRGCRLQRSLRQTELEQFLNVTSASNLPIDHCNVKRAFLLLSTV